MAKKVSRLELNNLDCYSFRRGANRGNCDGMGHYLCDECKFRKPANRR